MGPTRLVKPTPTRAGLAPSASLRRGLPRGLGLTTTTFRECHAETAEISSLAVDLRSNHPALGHSNEWPKVLIIPIEHELDILVEMAGRWRISIRRVPEAQLDVSVSDAKECCNERFDRRASPAL